MTALEEFLKCKCDSCSSIRSLCKVVGLNVRVLVKMLQKHVETYGQLPKTVILPSLKVGEMTFSLANINGVTLHSSENAFEMVDAKGAKLSELVAAISTGIKGTPDAKA